MGRFVQFGGLFLQISKLIQTFTAVLHEAKLDVIHLQIISDRIFPKNKN